MNENNEVCMLLPKKGRDLLIAASKIAPDKGPGQSVSRTQKIEHAAATVRYMYPGYFIPNAWVYMWLQKYEAAASVLLDENIVIED